MDYIDVYKRLFDMSKAAGKVAMMMQKGIVNEGKEVEEIVGEDAYHKAMREAKTKVDEMVQEMLLGSLLPTYKDILTLDVEEDTSSINLYPKKDYMYTLVLDPIDGTYDYLHQFDTYSICSAILHEHDVKVCIVYFPARNKLYGYVEGRGVRVYHEPWLNAWDEGEKASFEPHKKIPKRIYKNSRVPHSMIDMFLKQGFEIIDDSEQRLGCPDAIRECLHGNALAYVCDHRNIRDILLGAILSKCKYGHSYDYHGIDILWNQHGRQEEAIFSLYDKTYFLNKF